MLQQIANNAAGWLSMLLGFRGDEDAMDKKTDQAKQINVLHALACVAFLRQESGQDWNEKAAQVFGYLNAEVAKEKAGSMARAFLLMGNVPAAWRILADLFTSEDGLFGTASRRLRTAILALISALMRARFNYPKDHDEIAQALFNLGVDINIHSRKTADPTKYVPLRILANALGLWWALMRARNEAEAIGPFHGGDCAVNLFGALTESPMQTLRSQHEEAIRLLGDAIHTEMRGGVDAIRVGNSYEEMFGEEPRSATLERKSAAATLAGLIEAFLKSRGFNFNDKGDLQTRLNESFEATTAEIMHWAFSQIETGVYQSCLAGWVAVAKKLVALSEEQSYESFKGKIPTSLQGFGIIGYTCERIDEPLDTHYLSRTLRDRDLMRGVFGLN